MITVRYVGGPMDGISSDLPIVGRASAMTVVGVELADGEEAQVVYTLTEPAQDGGSWYAVCDLASWDQRPANDQSPAAPPGPARPIITPTGPDSPAH